MTEVTISMLDALGIKLREATTDYQAKKKVSSEAFAVVEDLKQQFISLLNECGKKSYKIDGVGNIVKKESLYCATPKDTESKKQLFSYIKDNMGDDGFWSYISINSNTLQSLYKDQMESSPTPEIFRIPGVGEPVLRETISFTKG